MRGPTLDEIEGNLDADDPRLWGDPGADLDERDALRSDRDRLAAELELAHEEIASLREEVAELTDEIEDRIAQS